ncbi:hypothetical protein ACWEQU_12900 [Streptomyces nodosus]
MNLSRRTVLLAGAAAALTPALPLPAASAATRFLGGTCRRAFHVGGLGPEPGESVARFELRAVGELYNVWPPAPLTHRW